jgi:hypothetical protein
MTGPETQANPGETHSPKRRALPTPALPAAPPSSQTQTPELLLSTAPEPLEDDHPHSVVEALSTNTAVSFYISLAFHLLLPPAAIVLLPLLGFDIIELITEEQPPLQAALADENLLDDAARFEVVAELPNSEVNAADKPQQLAAKLQISDSAWLKSSVDDIWNNTGASRSKTDDPANSSGVLLKIPEGGLAVTKGSFTAFTIPARPTERQSYLIVIEVKLPEGVKTYRVSDLSGKVKGSDGYEQKLPIDSRFRSAAKYPGKGKILELKSDTVLNVENNRVQIIIRVPGGARLVRDEISIRSRRLRESQELELIFSNE